MALTIVREEGYSEDYEGITTALGVYNRVNKYFWEALQNRHIAILNERLDSFDDDDKYISKVGVCTYVTNYFVANAKDIDLNNKTIKEIRAKNEAYKAQLGVLEEDYKKLLNQNTTEFINVMQLVAQYTTYADVKPLFDQATEYYYMMNIDEGTEGYIADYEALRSRLAAIEASNSTFLAIVNGEITDSEGNYVYTALANARTKSELYVTLSACYEYIDDLDVTYEGVSEALSLYNSSYAEYVSEAKKVNAEIAQTVDTTLAVRGNWDIDSIIAFVKKLFNR